MRKIPRLFLTAGTALYVVIVTADVLWAGKVARQIARWRHADPLDTLNQVAMATTTGLIVFAGAAAFLSLWARNLRRPISDSVPQAYRPRRKYQFWGQPLPGRERGPVRRGAARKGKV